MKKWYIAKNLQDEENWINHIQETGFRLVKVNPYLGSYTFEKRETGDFFPTVRLDFHQSMKTADYPDYLSLFTDSGWTLLKGSSKDSVHYFQKTALAKEDVLFSDSESQVAFYQRYRQQMIASFLIFFSLFLALFTLFYRAGFDLTHPKRLFLTPHLWEMTGWHFSIAFLLEFPFVLLFRSPFLCLLMLIIAGFYLYRAYKGKKLIEEKIPK